MSGVNKVILVGYVGKDASIKTKHDGERWATFSLATSDRWKDKTTGDQREKTEWHNIVVYNDRLIGAVEQNARKGARLYVEGKLQTRKYEADGIDRYVTEIVLAAFRGDIQLLSAGGGGSSGGRRPNPELDDDIPF